MARETLPTALELTFGHEGAYSSAPTDRGNYLNGVLVGTKYGITGATLAAHRGVRTVTAAQVKGMSLREAEDIYRRFYWSQSGGDVLPLLASTISYSTTGSCPALGVRSKFCRRFCGFARTVTSASRR